MNLPYIVHKPRLREVAAQHILAGGVNLAHKFDRHASPLQAKVEPAYPCKQRRHFHRGCGSFPCKIRTCRRIASPPSVL